VGAFNHALHEIDPLPDGRKIWELSDEELALFSDPVTRPQVTGCVCDIQLEIMERLYLFSKALGFATPTAKLPSVALKTKSTLSRGREMHKDYLSHLHDPSQQRFKEYVLPSGRRIDFLDVQKGIIYELKPFNVRAMNLGQRQANRYMQELQTIPQYKGINWKIQIDTY
jgi:hypothetical protein